MHINAPPWARMAELRFLKLILSILLTYIIVVRTRGVATVCLRRGKADRTSLRSSRKFRRDIDTHLQMAYTQRNRLFEMHSPRIRNATVPKYSQNASFIKVN